MLMSINLLFLVVSLVASCYIEVIVKQLKKQLCVRVHNG